MAIKKVQKEQDLQELTDKVKTAKSIVFTDYRGTTVKDLDRFRKSLRKENVFSKVYKMSLVQKALTANGIDASSVDYKTPVILSLSEEDETTAARIIKGLTKEVKTLAILEGVVDGKVISKAQVEIFASLPTRDQLLSQLLSVFNGPMSAFARLLNARAEKISEGAPAAPVVAEVSETPSAPEAPEAPASEAPAEAAPVAA